MALPVVIVMAPSSIVLFPEASCVFYGNRWSSHAALQHHIHMIITIPQYSCKFYTIYMLASEALRPATMMNDRLVLDF